MDADGMTFVCATRLEARAARRAGLRAAVVGIGAARPLPNGPLVSFGLAGALHDSLVPGDVLDAVRIVDAEGETLWEGAPLGVSGARQATMLAADRVVDDPALRRALRERTGADAVDMESGALLASGRLAGCLRAVSDSPARTLGPLARAVDERGRLRPRGIAGLLVRPRQSLRGLADVRRALRRLGEVTA